MKEIETNLFRTLQQTDAFTQFLTELDQIIAENRDKTRFQFEDKRNLTMDSLFGSIEVSRNYYYYYDRESEKYISLLDQHLQFEGAKGLSPLVQEMAMELAVEGKSYRYASHTLEKILGYSVIAMNQYANTYYKPRLYKIHLSYQ